MIKKVLGLLFGILFSIIVFSQEKNLPIEGYWYGLLEIQGSTLIITFEVQKDKDDSLIGYMYSPLQTSEALQMSKISLTGDSIIFRVKSLSVKYNGVISEGDSIIEGIFQQSFYKIPLTFKRTPELFTLKRPQEPKPPFGYIQDSIIFRNSKDSIGLAGTLTHPKGKGPFPALILITGSGPQNRDEEIFKHKPFKVMAHHFTSNGWAVLRYDDRGTGLSQGNFNSATSMDFAKDAQAAIKYLRQNPLIDTSKIGIIGHSEGGMIAPIITAYDKRIRFIVMLAGPSVTGEKILLSQTEKILRLNKSSKKQIKRSLDDAKQTYKILNKNPKPSEATLKIRHYFEKRARKISKDSLLQYGYSKQSIEIQIQILNSPWFRYFISFDPQNYLKKVDCPLLALYGSKDVQVIADINVNQLQQIIKSYKKDNFSIKVYEGKNHLFQNAQKGTVNEYALIEETISTDVLDDILKWMNSVVAN